MEKFEQTAKLSYFDVDALNQIKLSVLIDLLLKVSSYQLDTMGVGTNNLARENLGWVVTQYHMEIKRLPQLDEEIILGTQPTGYNRFFLLQRFLGEDPGGGIPDYGLQYVDCARSVEARDSREYVGIWCKNGGTRG
ncbi:acyl-ACP thioesterase domain-containing protein [Amylolactobacillus amylophilus]|uniref:acyl-ACP thioesterase domain-containing protein n=1 Tax=Amylolactobacillus amylophilus TaxID=1603 RepID=UPI0006D19D68|nr:acyl-ACP thioesterase domain-containing protein [Amylolactobacillus amylophilus]